MVRSMGGKRIILSEICLQHGGEHLKVLQIFADILISFLYSNDITRTVLNREIWFDSLGKIFGGWGLYEDGQFTTESIENFMLFVPFSILLLWAFQKNYLMNLRILDLERPFGKP